MITSRLLMFMALAASRVAVAQDATPMLPPVPPVAEKHAHAVTAPHGATRDDPYYWLRDDTRRDPRVLAWLRAENAFTDAMLRPHQALIDTLYAELVARIKPDDASVPSRHKDYWYYTRYVPGKEYPVVARRRGSMQADEEVLLDGNAMASGKAFFQIGRWEISPDQQHIAWAEDISGRRQYVVRAKRLGDGKPFDDTIADTSGDIVWGDDNASLYYVENDPVTLLARRVKRHAFGQPVASDPVLYEETDTTFYMSIDRTRSERYVCIAVQSTVSSETRCSEAAKADDFRVIAPRTRDIEYQADHLGDRWVIRTNWQAPNYRVMTAGDDLWGDRVRWKEWIAARDDVAIEGFELFDGFVALAERSEALLRLRVLPTSGKPFFIDADEPAYAMDLDANPDPHSGRLRYTYSSLTTPTTTYEVDVATGKREQLKRAAVLGGFDPANYVTERVWAKARDGTRVPVSMVYRKGFKRGSGAPLLQRGYGSYGASSDPVFDASVISLLDRGMVYAIAHVRGGQELGRRWYDDGKLLNKINTFTDFIDVTAHLVAQGYAGENRVAATGRSAGGLLMGAIANMAPSRYAVIHTAVPFVDVVTTMLDASIPLTSNEYDEWGNPADRAYYDYMLSYSPYDQVSAQDYPAMYVSTGLWDSQVQYFEPAKWVARLRATRTDAMPLLFRINMEAGHGGSSGRFQRQRETAEWYAFMLRQLGATQRID